MLNKEDCPLAVMRRGKQQLKEFADGGFKTMNKGRFEVENAEGVSLDDLGEGGEGGAATIAVVLETVP
jgi:hypothetical protein